MKIQIGRKKLSIETVKEFYENKNNTKKSKFWLKFDLKCSLYKISFYGISSHHLIKCIKKK